jgi:hypothetical protein
MQYATYEFGSLITQRNEEARSRYLATVFEVVSSIFHRSVINRPEEVIEGQEAANGRVEHRFSVRLAILELGFSDSI